MRPAEQATQLPAPLQTWLVPQAVPAALFAASAQTSAPVAHEVEPVRQTLGLVPQLVPEVHATHAPVASQTRLVPQPVPTDFWVPLTHVVVPAEQDVVPLKHAALGLPPHACPAVQVPQKPAPSQTCPAPHRVPPALGEPSAQTALPEPQATTPLAHAAFGLDVHAMPAAHDTQTPVPLQTWLVPQLRPAALGIPFAQTGPPLAQVVAPLKHAGDGLVVQLAPSVQATQAPSELQTRLVPQLVPVAFGALLAHVCTPVLQDVVPVKHGLGLVVQAVPAVHAAQAPAPLQTWFVPQLVPADLLPESMHCWLPVVQEVTPVRQDEGLVVQDIAELQATQVAAVSQTWLVPQLVPADLLMESAQTCAPVLHEVSPVLQTPGLVVHAAPPVQAAQEPATSHTRFEPQLVPGGLLVLSTQLVVLPAQLVVPSLQSVPGLLVQL